MKLKLLFLVPVCLYALSTKASSVLASSYGWNATDATNALAAAIQSNYDTVIVDLQASDWITKTNTYFDISNKTIIFKPGVNLVAKKNAFSRYDCLFKLIRCNNINIIGYGATFKMQKAEYTTSEYRHTLAISNCNHISVYGLLLKDSGGDGIFISGDTFYGTQYYSADIFLKDIVCDNHKRQGFSIISAQNLRVESCTFQNTKGTLPEAGVDLEPDQIFHRLVNISFKNCRFINNNGHGIDVSIQNLNKTSLPISISFENCVSENNHATTNAYVESELVFNSSADGQLQGNVSFKNCLVENSKWSAVNIRKTIDEYTLNFSNCVFRNVSQVDKLYNTPVWIEVTDYSNPCPRFGGANFSNVLIDTKSTQPFIWANSWSTSPGPGNITGNFTVVNTNAITTHIDPTPLNVTFTHNDLSVYPSTSVKISKQDAIASEGGVDNAIFKVIRTGSNKTFPLAVKYTETGTATPGNDYTALPLFKIIPATVAIEYDTLVARRDEINEPVETALFTLGAASGYTIASPSTQTLKISGNNTVAAAQKIASVAIKNNVSIYPNPVADILYITVSSNKNFEIFDASGKKILQGQCNTKIDVSKLSRGLYFINIMDVENKLITTKNFIKE